MTDRGGAWINVFSGNYFYPLEPLPEEIHIEDIAHALSLVRRFNGHTRVGYSVGQHSLLASQIVPPQDALWGLLHDASEAYISDVSRPVKPHIVNYREIEDRLMRCVAERFDLPWPMPPSIKWADDVLVCTERRDLMNPGPNWGPWCDGVELLQERIIPMQEATVEYLFLHRFEELGGKR